MTKCILSICLIFSLTIVTSCSNINQKTSSKNNFEDKFTSIETSNYGGMMGYSETWKFTKDSMYNTVIYSVKNEPPTTKRLKMEEATWLKLNEAFDWENFKKIKNGETNMTFDGIDDKIVVVGKGETFTVINGEKDSSNYQKLSVFTSLLDSLSFPSN